MSTPSRQQCACIDPHYCRCPNSKWRMYYPPPTGFPNPPQYYSNIQPLQYAMPAQPLRTSLLSPSGPRSAFPYAGSPSMLGPPPASFRSPSNMNPIPFPLIDATAPTLNTSPVPPPHAPGKRKRVNANSSSKTKKRPRASATSQSVSTPANPIATASIVGVGPTAQELSATSSSGGVAAAAAAVASSITNPTYNAINAFLKHSETGRDGAIDVYWFLRPLDTDKEPVPLPEPGDFSKPLITRKPKSDYLGCRLCVNQWRVWKNSKGGITSTIRRHLESEHKDVYLRSIQLYRLRPGPELDEEQPFLLDHWISLLVDWIVADDQSLNVVDCPEFRKFVVYGHNNATDQDLPHRTSLTNKIYAQYIKDYEELINEMKTSLGRVSFTSDIWSDPNLTAFLGMTAHFCKRNKNGSLEVANQLLAFRLVEGSHDGENIGKIMFDIIKDANAHRKIGQITLDNAANCNTAMEKIQRCCAADGIAFDADGNHNRCFPHVINIAVQTIIKELKENPSMVVSGAVRDSMSTEEVEVLKNYEAAIQADPIGKSRSIVSTCRSSGQRRVELREIILDGNRSGLWKLRLVQLLRDVDTRWSALFGMIGRVIELYQAISVFLNKAKHASFSSYLFTEAEYQALNDIHDILSLPHATQELLSAEKTPTIALALPAFEVLIDAWLQKQKVIPELAHYIGVGIAKLQEYVRKCRHSRIYGLAMIINPAYKLDWIQQHWTEQEAKDAREWILEAMTSFCTEKRHEQEKAICVPLKPLRSETLPHDLASEKLSRGMDKLLNLQSAASVRRTTSLPPLPGSNPVSVSSSGPANTITFTPEPGTGSGSNKSSHPESEKLKCDRKVAEQELALYLSAGLVKVTEGTNLIRFWDVNETRYPLLFRVAVDILPVQASAVPCERIFSSSKETCTDRRNRILPKLLEALQFRKFKCKQARLNFMEDFIAREEDYIIGGEVTDYAAAELMSLGRVEELTELLRNSRDATEDSSSQTWAI